MSDLETVKPDLFLYSLTPEQAIEHVDGIRYHFQTARTHFQEASRLAWELHSNHNWRSYPGQEESTWEEFSQAVFGTSRMQVHRLVTGYRVNRNLSEAGEQTKVERHARALAAVPDDLQAQVYQEAKATAPINPHTHRPQLSARHIEETAERILVQKQVVEEAEEETSPIGLRLATTNKSQSTAPLGIAPRTEESPGALLPLPRASRPLQAEIIRTQPLLHIHFNRETQEFRFVLNRSGTAVMSMSEFFQQCSAYESFLVEHASKSRLRSWANRIRSLALSIETPSMQVIRKALEAIARELEA